MVRCIVPTQCHTMYNVHVHVYVHTWWVGALGPAPLSCGKDGAERGGREERIPHRIQAPSPAGSQSCFFHHCPARASPFLPPPSLPGRRPSLWAGWGHGTCGAWLGGQVGGAASEVGVAMKQGGGGTEREE